MKLLLGVLDSPLTGDTVLTADTRLILDTGLAVDTGLADNSEHAADSGIEDDAKLTAAQDSKLVKTPSCDSLLTE